MSKVFSNCLYMQRSMLYYLFITLLRNFMQSHATSIEQQIQAEIEELRAQFPETQELYREVCILLFFRHGMTPTANKLYQMVRRGSMSAPAEALAKFWSDLREKSRVRIENPDLPEDLKNAAGELVATLWTKAQAEAYHTVASIQAEAQATATEAKTAENATKARLDTIVQELAEARQTLDQASERIQILEQNLAGEIASRTMTEAQLHRSQAESVQLQQAIENARRDFAAELDKLRSSANLTEERYRAAEDRALLEIDRERQAAAKAQKELESLRSTASRTNDRHRNEMSAMLANLGDLQRQAGILEGNLHEATLSRDRLISELEGVRKELADVSVQATMLRLDAENWRQRAEKAELAVEKPRVLAKAKPRRAKSTSTTVSEMKG